MREHLRYLLLGCLLCMMLPLFAAFAEGIHDSIKEWRKMKWIASLLAALAVMVGGALASYTGLLVSSGGNLYEITSGGVLTLVNSSSLGISVGALAQGSQTSSTSTIWALNSAGTDLYAISLSAGPPQVISITHKCTLAATCTGLAYLGGTLYTTAYQGGSTPYGLYTINVSTGALSSTGFSLLNAPKSMCADASNVWTVAPANTGQDAIWPKAISGTETGGDSYTYSGGTNVSIDLVATDGTTLWIIDNVTSELSDSTLDVSGTVTVTATSVASYNGMCWGFVPW